MFDIGWSEMLVIAIVIIVVVGPKELPGMLRAFGKTTSKLRVMANDFRRQFDEALKEAELDDVKKLADDVRGLNPANQVRQALSPMEQAARDVRAGIDTAMNPAPAATSTPVAPAVAASESAPSAPTPPVAAVAPAAPATAPKSTAKTSSAAKAKAAPVAKASVAPVAAKPKAAPAAKAVAAPKSEAKPKAAAKPRAAAKPKAGGAKP